MRLISHSSSTPDGLVHPLADGLAQQFDLRRGGIALVDEKVAVQLRNLGRTDREAPAAPPASINCQDFVPGGFLKVEPPVRLLIGCVASRLLVISSMARGDFGRIAGPPLQQRLGEDQILRRTAMAVACNACPHWKARELFHSGRRPCASTSTSLVSPP